MKDWMDRMKHVWGEKSFSDGWKGMWMDGWMDGWLEGWMDVWVDGLIGLRGWIESKVDVFVSKYMDEWVNE